MPTCVSCMNFVAIDADACPACGGKAKTDLDDSIRNQQIAEAAEEMGHYKEALFWFCCFL